SRRSFSFMAAPPAVRYRRARGAWPARERRRDMSPTPPRSVSLPLPARHISGRGLRGLVEAQDRLLDLGIPPLGERDLRGYDRESFPLARLARPNVVTRGPGEHGPSPNRFQQQAQRPTGDALPPEGPVDPVRHLGIAVNDEAADTADEPSIDGDRADGRLR